MAAGDRLLLLFASVLCGWAVALDRGCAAPPRWFRGDSTCAAAPSRLSGRWAARRSVDKVRLAVVPLGAIEQHGPHLPLGTDLILAEAFGAAIDRHFGDGDVAVLPASPFGASFEHAAFSGTIAVPDDVLQGLWGSILASVAAAGVRSAILLNAHGGQTPNAQIAVRRARFETTPPLLAILVDLQALIHDCKSVVLAASDLSERDWAWEAAHGIHGGLVETALMLHLQSHLVDAGAASRFEPRATARAGRLEPHGDVVSFGWQAQDIFPRGAGGDASRATPELGRRIFEHASEALLRIVADTRDASPESVLFSGQ
jgi:creatinine amidohydrolase